MSFLRSRPTANYHGRRSEREQPLGNFQWPRALLYMDNLEHREKPPITREEREAKKERARKDAEKALAAHKKEGEENQKNLQ